MRSREFVRFNFHRPLFTILFCVIAVVGASGQTRNTSTARRTVTVVTEPNSTVWIDGLRYGVTDDRGRLTISSVSTGVHSIRVRSNGFSEAIKSLPAASSGEIAIKLTKTTDEAVLAFQSAEAATTVDRQKAIAEYQRAIKLRPKYPEAYLGLARMYSETRELEKADKAVRMAKRLRPGYAEASAVEGRIAKDSDQEERAIAAFKRAIAEGKGFQPEAYTGLGLLYKERAESIGASADLADETASYNEAIKNLAVAARQLGGAPDAVVVYQLLGLIYEKQKKYKEAITLYEEFLRLFPDVSEAEAVRSFIVQLRKQMAEQ